MKTTHFVKLTLLTLCVLTSCESEEEKAEKKLSILQGEVTSLEKQLSSLQDSVLLPLRLDMVGPQEELKNLQNERVELNDYLDREYRKWFKNEDLIYATNQRIRQLEKLITQIRTDLRTKELSMERHLKEEERLEKEIETKRAALAKLKGHLEKLESQDM